MKKILIMLLAVIYSANTQAQFLTQSAEGKSSIPLPLNGIGVGIDIGKTEVAFGLNNYARVLNDSSKFLIGLNLSAKNSDGLANLFSGGDIVPQGDFLGFVGFSCSNNNRILTKYKKDTFYTKYQANIKAKQILFDTLKEKVIRDLDSAAAFVKNDVCIKNRVVPDLTKKIRSVKEIADLDSYINNYKIVGLECDSLVRFKAKLIELYTIVRKEYATAYNAIVAVDEASISDFKKFIKRQVPLRITGFLQGGFSARSFTRFISLSMPDLSNSFQDTLFKGGLFGVGVNLQIRNFWVGVTYSFVAGDNFAALKSKEYTLRTADTSGNQVLVREKKITAYSGKYAKVNSNELNIDLVGDFKLSDTSRLLASFYLRSSLASRDTAYLKNYTNIGAGLYFIGKKGKFLGGLYVELPDVNNNFEKAKPANEINIRSPYKKLTFGIVTKFNISSIFAWANRPTKPD
ncbi:MAG TPA: hypothetical protein VK484_11025 [Ferruginibacter sp.]|nr:hypothetical protein [Ferruginibacter sp.]